MATDYVRFAELARRLIAGAGRTATFEHLSATPADANKPWKGPAAPTVATSKDAPAAFVPPSGSGLGKELVSDELLARCEQVCLVAPSEDAYAFETATSIQDGGVRWRVTWAYVLAPGPLPVLYALGVAR